MKKVIIYTDGACSGNPGMGGWGAILIYNGMEKEISGFNEETTNNRMELVATIEALNSLREPCEVELYSDSAYVVNAFDKKWIDKWKTHNWTRPKSSGLPGSPLKNVDLWKELSRLSMIHNIKWIKVKGHSDNEFNNRCDQLATGEIKEHR